MVAVTGDHMTGGNKKEAVCHSSEKYKKIVTILDEWHLSANIYSWHFLDFLSPFAIICRDMFACFFGDHMTS